MNKPNPTSNTSQSPVKKRSARERVLVWGGILLLLLVVLAEWASRSSFDSTMSNIEEAIHASKGKINFWL